MKIRVPSLLALIAFATTLLGDSPDPALLAKAYLQAREATMQAGATPADVDKVLALCTANLVYEHPRVGIKIEGDAVGAGMRNFLGSSRNARITVTKSLPGAGMVAVETDVVFEAQGKDGWTKVARRQVWVFEFEGPKIKRILEYW
jgi:hypothetical protein